MKRGASGRVAERLADLADAEIQALLEVHERIAAPDVFADLVAGHHFTAAAGEQFEHLEGLRGELEQVAVMAQLAGAGFSSNAPNRRTAGALIENSSRTQRRIHGCRGAAAL